MRTWGRNLLRESRIDRPGALVRAVGLLPPHVKQAFYAAAEKQIIKRGTWDGCAFNAVTGTNSFQASAEALNIPEPLVRTFIKAWDSLQGDDVYATRTLREVIKSVGLFSTPDEVQEVLAVQKEENKVREIRITIFESREDKERRIFEEMVSGLDIEDGSELSNDIQSVKVLLNA